MARKGFREGLFDDWPAKVLSLAAALLVFLFYRLNRLEERYVSVPLAVVLNDQYVPANVLPHTVKLTLRGESSALVSILEDDLKAYVDLSRSESEGSVTAAIAVERKGSALGVEPLEIGVDPVSVTASLERKARRVVPITPSFRGYLDPGYELASFDLEPSEALVTGPAGAVARLLDLSTDFIELSGRRSAFSVDIRVFPKDPLVTVAGKASATFRATVEEAVEHRDFPSVPIQATGLAEGLVLADPPPACSVRLRSSKAQLRGFELPPDLVTLDLSALRKPGAYTLPLAVNLPEGFALDSIDPATATIRLVSGTGGTR